MDLIAQADALMKEWRAGSDDDERHARSVAPTDRDDAVMHFTGAAVRRRCADEIEPLVRDLIAALKAESEKHDEEAYNDRNAGGSMGDAVSIPRDVAVRVDSLLSALLHHHTSLDKTVERAEAELLITAVRYACDRPSLRSSGGQRAEWQPIETAPKDGTFFLALDRKDQFHRAHWDTRYEPRWTDWHGYLLPWLLHWRPMPLPKPVYGSPDTPLPDPPSLTVGQSGTPGDGEE